VPLRREPGRLHDRRAYYDAFSAGYDRGRDRGYHAFVDRAELDAILPRAQGRHVLEAGCGTGLLLGPVSGAAAQAVGVDLSTGMLSRARSRGLTVTQADLTALPFPDASFELIYSCKVLAHVPDLRAALAELDRVAAPGATLLVEVYNRRSLRYAVRRLRPGLRVARGRTDAEIYTRFDTEAEVRAASPDGWCPAGRRGIRVATVVPQLFAVPGLGRLWARIERGLGRSPLGALGGFLVLEFRKEGRADEKRDTPGAHE